MWYFNETTGNFYVGDAAPTKEVTTQIIGANGLEDYTETAIDTDFTQIADRPEPFDDYIFNGTSWVVKPIVKTVPPSITIRQAKLQLLAMDKLADVELFIDGNEALKIEWDYASLFKRNSQVLNDTATAMGLTQDMIDDFFIAASKL